MLGVGTRCSTINNKTYDCETVDCFAFIYMQTHKTVMLQEAVAALEIKPAATIVDATFGSAGHANAIVKNLAKGGVFVGIDADKTALNKDKLEDSQATVHLVNDNFSHITDVLETLKIESVDGILADLGWRMEQFSDSGKGFSFQNDEPLYMTFGEPDDYPFTVEDILNEWEEHVIADILYGYANERFARRIAKAVIRERKIARIATTKQLVEVVEGALPRAALHRKTHPATKTFQALRIAVNDELTVLETFIAQAFEALNVGGKLAIITFHSIEDRIVKHTFRELKQAGVAQLTPKKPISPSREEIIENPRARSAKLRVLTKQ